LKVGAITVELSFIVVAAPMLFVGGVSDFFEVAQARIASVGLARLMTKLMSSCESPWSATA
jgi:hypothetical protein